MTDLTPEMKEAVDATVRVVLLEMIRDMPLMQLGRMVFNVRWGALGRAIDKKRLTPIPDTRNG